MLHACQSALRGQAVVLGEGDSDPENQAGRSRESHCPEGLPHCWGAGGGAPRIRNCKATLRRGSPLGSKAPSVAASTENTELRADQVKGAPGELAGEENVTFYYKRFCAMSFLTICVYSFDKNNFYK